MTQRPRASASVLGDPWFEPVPDYAVVSTGAPFTSYEINSLNLLQKGDLGQSLEDADLWHV